MSESDNLEYFVAKGFLTDQEVLEVTQYIRDNEPKQCIWYKCPSLLDNPDMKAMCHDLCDGRGVGCNYTVYQPKELE